MGSYSAKAQRYFGKITAILVLFVLSAVIWLSATPTKQEGLYIHFLNVGQGDAELIQTPSHQNILIDGGPNDTVVSELDKHIPFYNRKIDAIILSHPHADHAGGLPAVLDKYSVSSVYFTGVVYTSPPYLKFLEAIKNKRIVTHSVKAGDSLELGDGAKLDFLYPLKSIAGATSESMNNTSIVARLSYGKSAALFTGDIENEAQLDLLSSSQNLSANILKVAHHGSKGATNTSFLEAVKPQYAVIEVGKKNTYGHPHADALKLMQGIQIFRTDTDGDVSFILGKLNVSRVGETK